MEEILKEILREVKHTNSRIDKIEEDVRVLKEDVSGLKANVKVLTEDVNGLKTNVANLNEEVKVLNEKVNDMAGEVAQLNINYDLMDSRQREMYLILKGWEEDRPIQKKILDDLTVNMDRLKNHKHKISFSTEKIEAF